MRLVKISAPEGSSKQIAKLAFSVGIKKATVQKGETLSAEGEPQTKDLIDIDTSTPKAKQFVDALLEADFYNPEQYTIITRQPRSIVSGESIREITKPLVEPVTDIFEELWQYSHITVGFIGRIFIAACLLAFGLIHQKILIILAGLLFLPLLPLLLAIGFGSWTKQPKLAVQGLLAFATATILLVSGGAAVAAFSNPPLQYDDFNSLPVSLLISLAVGVAAGLANVDEVGSRAMIGLAATAQIAIIPVWFGICFVFGFPATTSESEITTRAAVFFLNILTIIAASLAAYILLGAASRALGHIKSDD
jgi:hypothetical protein